MESTAGGSSEARAAGSAMPRGNGNQNVTWSTARRSSRKAPNRCWEGEAATRLEGQHRKSKLIKTIASARDSSTTSTSKVCAKRWSEQAMDGNITTSLSKKCKRMDSKRYIALFETPSNTGLVFKNAKRSSVPTKTNKIKESLFQKLQRLPNGCHPDFDNDHLCAVNKLREFWHKSQGAGLVDDKEIVMKTVLFIMSVLPDVCQPFLVVTTASLSLWEAEFKRLAPIINVVVYDGDKEAHKSIQDLKFNTNRSSMMSHVFLARPDAILEDIETIRCSSWEAVIVEYCQNSVLRLLKQLKQLPTDCRIVLLRSLPEDNLLEYKNLVAFLSSEEEDNGDHVDDALAILKAKFTHHIAYERKTDSSNLLEYWVPTYLSKVQIQLYSSILLTNSSVLQSQVATDSVGALGDIVQCLWKCCDHPFLVDEFPHNSLVNIDDDTESTDNRMCASGKLLLLEEMLREFRNKKSRVIVLFQSDGPGEKELGKILEEFVCHRFGPESYEHVQNHSAYSKKQAAMTMFNDRTKGRFVFLIENHACHSSICLSSIDAVIIYSSNWDPLNDLKALEKIEIESPVEYVSIFRLYTPFTVEEKGLMLAKQGVIIDCNIQDIVPSLSHSLLSWGVSFIFSRLDELHQGNPSSKSSESGALFTDKVISEFLTVLSTNSNGATISKAYKSGEFYSRNITLVGEREGAYSLDVDPPRFWLNLLDGKSPCHLSEQPLAKHRNLQYMEKLTNDPDEETNKGRRRHGKTGGTASSSSKTSSDVSNIDLSPEITPSGADLQNDTRQRLGMGNLSTPKSLHVQLKCELSKLIKLLELPDNVKFLAEQLLEYLLENHLVVREPRGLLHAFNIALCWRAASLLKYNKLDRRDSLAVAASSLNYEHNEELAGVFYKKLATLKEKVQHKPDENSNNVENNMFSLEESSSTNQRNCHMFSKQEMDLHGNPTNSSPQESSSPAEQIVSDGKVVSAPEANRERHFSSGEYPNMIIKKRHDLFDQVFSVREKNIHEKQQLEILDFQTYRENQVIKLKEVCSLVLRHIQRSDIDECSRNDQTKLIVEWFTMLLYAFFEHMRLQLNKLEELQSKTWFKERLMKEKLKEEIVSGQLDQCPDLCTALPDSNFVIEDFIHFIKQNDDYHVGKSLALGCDQLLDDRLTMEITLVRNAVPSEAISTRRVGNEPAEALVSSGGASSSESVYLPENNINCSSDGIELQRACSSTVPSCNDNQLSSVSSQQSTDAPSRHQPVETKSMGMLGTQVEQELCPDMELSTSLLDVPPQRTFTDDPSQAGWQLDKTTDMSEEGETEYPTCATHDLATLSLSGEAETDIGQKSMPSQQSKSSCAQGSLPAFPHPPEEAESAGILGKLLPDDLHQSTSVQDQTAEAEQAGMLGVAGAQDLQHEIQPSMTTQDVPLERADLSGMLVTQSPTVLHGVEPSRHLHAEPSGTSIIAAAPNLIPEIQSSSSMQDGPVGAERSGTSGTIADQVLLPETQPSVSVQHIPPEGTHSDDMIQISLPGQQNTGLDSQQSVAASCHLAEHEEPAGILGVVVADAFQPSNLVLNQTAEAERAGSLDAVVTQDSHTELLPSSTTRDVPCEEADSSMPVPQGTTSQQSLEVSRDTHAEREPDNALGTLAAHDLQSGMHPLSSVQDQPVEAEGARQSDTISAQYLQLGTQPSTVTHHITPEIAHPYERIQMTPQPNETPSQMSLQPNEAPSAQLLAQLFSMGPAAFNQLMYSSKPLRNELEKLKYCKNLLTKGHQQKKLLLQAEYNKELEKLNRKYESLHHKEDSTYHRMAAQLDDIYYKVSMHQLVAENFHENLTKSYASQERSASPTTGQVPQTSQQAPRRTSGAQTTASLVASLSATRPPMLTPFHTTGPLRSEAIQLQPTLPRNLCRATSSPLNSIPQRNGSYGAAGSQLRGPAPHLQHLRTPQPYATVHRNHQQVPVIGPGFTSLRHPAPGILTSPLAGVPMTSISSSSLCQTMASASNSHPALPAPSLQPGSLAELMGNFVPTSSANPVVMAAQQVPTLNLDVAAGIWHTGAHIVGIANRVPEPNPVVMAAQQVPTLNPDAAAGIWHTGAHIAGVTNPVPEPASETLPFQQRWHTVMAGAVLPSIASSSAHPSASNSQPALATSSATNPFSMAGQQGPSPNLAFHNNSVPLNAAAGSWHTGTHVAVANQPVPDSASMNALLVGRSGVTSEPTSAGAQRGGTGEVVCLSDDE